MWPGDWVGSPRMEQGLSLTSPDGLVKQFIKSVLETALEEEMTQHLGHEKNRAAEGRESINTRNGNRPQDGLTHSGWRGSATVDPADQHIQVREVGRAVRCALRHREVDLVSAKVDCSLYAPLHRHRPGLTTRRIVYHHCPEFTTTTLEASELSLELNDATGRGPDSGGRVSAISAETVPDREERGGPQADEDAETLGVRLVVTLLGIPHRDARSDRCEAEHIHQVLGHADLL